VLAGGDYELPLKERKNMKKIIFLAALPLVFAAFSAFTPSVELHAADPVDTTPNFDEDFEGYSTLRAPVSSSPVNGRMATSRKRAITTKSPVP
jgi:hypothetical protein